MRELSGLREAEGWAEADEERMPTEATFHSFFFAGLVRAWYHLPRDGEEGCEEPEGSGRGSEQSHRVREPTWMGCCAGGQA